MAISDDSPLTFATPIKTAKIEHNEQLKYQDFVNIIQNPFDSLSKILSVLVELQSGKFEGLNMSVNKQMLILQPGYGCITNVDGNNKIEGTNLIINNETTDLFLLPMDILQGGNTIQVYLEYTAIDDEDGERNFIKEDGTYETKIIKTVTKGSFTSGYDVVLGKSLTKDKAVFNRLYLGEISLSNNNLIINNYATTTLTLYNHKTKIPIDHPDRSISASHLTGSLAGTYQEGTDLTIKQMSNFLRAMSGVFANPHERISQIIDENGNLDNEAIEQAVETLVNTHLSGLVDSQGNLARAAVDDMVDEVGRPMIYRMGVSGGMVHGDRGRMHAPDGFALSETIFFVSIADLKFPVYKGTTVQLVCQQSQHGICECYAQLDANHTKRYYGTAGYIGIAIKPRQK